MVDFSTDIQFKPYVASPDEDYMNKKQLGHFRNIIGLWRAGLKASVDNTINDMKEHEVIADPNDRATLEESFSLELRARDRERKLIKKLESTLDSIDSCDYGYCESCGVEIGIKRLEARPTATLCIDCKELSEAKER